MRYPRVDMEGIITVVALAETGDTVKAAELLNVGPSAIQKRLTKTESALVTKLFRRTAHGIVMTSDGKTYCSEAIFALEHAVLAEDKVAAVHKLRDKRLLLGHSTHLPRRLLTLLAQIKSENMEAMTIEDESGLSKEIERKVAHGLLHVGIGFLPVRHSVLATQVLMEEPLVLCLPKKHPLATRALLRPEDLDRLPVVAVARQPFPDFHEEVAEFYRGFGIELAVVADAFAPAEALYLVEQGIGVCFLSQSAASQNSAIVAIPLSTRILTRKCGVFYRDDNHHPTLRRFVKYVSNKCKQDQK
ncbi:MAG: LysR family transcriptional regulator [Acidobacteriaceae bacterium]